MRFLAKLLAVALVLPSIGFAQPGLYVKGEVGGVLLSYDSIDLHPFNPSGVAGRIALGNLWGDTQWNYGLEGGALYFPHASETFLMTTNYSGYVIDFLGVLKYTFQSNIALFGKAGAAYLYQKAKVRDTFFGTNTVIAHSSGRKFAPELALGMGYQFTPKIELDLTLGTVFASKPNASNPVATTNQAMLGLSYILS